MEPTKCPACDGYCVKPRVLELHGMGDGPVECRACRGKGFVEPSPAAQLAAAVRRRMTERAADAPVLPAVGPSWDPRTMFVPPTPPAEPGHIPPFAKITWTTDTVVHPPLEFIAPSGIIYGNHVVPDSEFFYTTSSTCFGASP